MEFDSIAFTNGVTRSSEGLPIRWDLYVPLTTGNREFPVILFVHGFKGFKDWGVFPDACEDMARAGFGVVAINLSLNGVGERKTEFDRLDLMGRQTFSQDLDDIERVISALQRGEIHHEKAALNTDDIGIVGHSRGGHVAVLAASEFDSVQCLVTWGAVGDYTRFWSEKMKDDWDNKGFTDIKNGRTGQIFQLKKEVYEDLLDNEERLSAIKRVTNLRIPALYIHSRNDESVPYTQSEQLHIHTAAQDKELRLLSGGGHTFGVTHPYDKEDYPEAFAEVLDWTVGWFREHLR